MSDEISLKKMIIISLLLHLVVLFMPLKTAVQNTGKALARELEKKPDEMTFIFVESPRNVAESKEKQVTPYISDKNLAAVNPQAPPNLPLGQPYQKGESEVPAMQSDQRPGQTAPPAALEQPRESGEETAQEKEIKAPDESFDAIRELEAASRLAPRKKEQPYIPKSDYQGERQPSSPSEPRFDNRGTRAPLGADFQLSTYNWNWAPYLKELKKRIESNVYPPPAFYMGLARGRTWLRFKIMQDGSITDFELITYTGHESLKNTSVKAIEASVPFLPLPSDFPEDYLGLTVGFYYNEFIH